LNDNFGCCRHRIFALSDGFSFDSLAWNLQVTGDKSLHLSIKLLFILVEIEHNYLRFSVFLAVFSELFFPVCTVGVTGNESWI
jgi:hypothetical protein